jgi:hypothetical protein
MAHFARLDENNIVTAVHVVHNNELAVDTEVVIEDGFVKEKLVLSEERGIQFLQSLYGADTRWAQTSYNNKFRGWYAGIGYTFDAQNNVFVAPEGPVVETPVVDPVVELAQTVETAAVPTLTSDDIQALSSADVQALSSTDVQALSSADIPALTTSDISSLG